MSSKTTPSKSFVVAEDGNEEIDNNQCNETSLGPGRIDPNTIFGMPRSTSSMECTKGATEECEDEVGSIDSQNRLFDEGLTDAASLRPSNDPLMASNNTTDTDHHLSKMQASLASSGIGATHVDERAPDLNLRFFRLAARRPPRIGASLPRRSRRNNNNTRQTSHSTTRPMSNIVLEEQEMTTSGRPANNMFRSSLSGSGFSERLNSQGSSQSNSQGSLLSWRRFGRRSNPTTILNATPVEPMEVAEAKPVGFCDKHGKHIGSISAIFVTAFIIILTLSVKGVIKWRKTAPPTLAPSSQPTMAPTYDPRPTLAIIQERGMLRCGLHQSRSTGTFRYQLCQAVAAVALNSPNKTDIIEVTAESRFIALNERTVDLLSGGETYTVEREVNEPTTGASFSFSTPYYYDGMAFAGNKTFVTCAENQKRYDECSQLIICVTGSTTDHGYVASHFSSEFYVMTTGLDESIQFYFNDTCNVVGSSRLDLLNYKNSHAHLLDSTFVIGDTTFNNDPLAYVTRPGDTEWSNIVNWCLQALFYGERQGMTKNAALCQSNTDALSANGSELNFLNAVYCVGNYAEIYNSSELAHHMRTAINTINHGTPMIYEIPYGNLHNANDEMFYNLSKTFAGIKNRNKIRCGLLNNTISPTGLVGMGHDYCQTLASSMLDGNLNGVNITEFQDEERSLKALNNMEVDVLLGVSADKSLNFDTQTLAGVVFSTSYYYGSQNNQTENSTDAIFYPIMTRREDSMFSSFVNCILLSTFHAADQGIDQYESHRMPSITIFGNDMLWALKDAISAMGNYNDIYLKNFPDGNRGRNNLNSEKEPQLLDMPGLES